MRNVISIIAILLFLSLPSYALTGLGIGIHGGQTTNYSYDLLDNRLGDIAESLGVATDAVTFDEELITIGAHLKVGTLPILDFYGFVDYSWKKKEIYNGLDFRVSDVAVGATAKKTIGIAVLKPYVGAGFEIHRLAYSLESDQVQINGVPVNALVVPEDQNKLGYHLLLGAELNFPVFPIDPYVQYRYTWITTDDEPTKYGLIEAGLTLSL